MDADARFGVLILVGPEVQQLAVPERARKRGPELLRDLQQERRGEAVDGVRADVAARVVGLGLIEDGCPEAVVAERGERRGGERAIDDYDVRPPPGRKACVRGGPVRRAGERRSGQPRAQRRMRPGEDERPVVRRSDE